MLNQVPLFDESIALNFITLKGDSVIFFGAGEYVEILIHCVKQLNINSIIICDNDINKHGSFIGGYKITSPKLAYDNFPTAKIVVSTSPRHIENLKITALEIGWKHIFDGAFLLANFSYDSNSFKEGLSSLHFKLDRFFFDYFKTFYPEKLVMPSLDVVVTEKCSLKCKDCSNLMQYYEAPKDQDFDTLFASLDKVMDSVDHVMELRVLGGETFMNRQAYLIINNLRKYKNYSRICVYSNGTIISRGEDLNCLKYEDTYLRISDYGEYSKNTLKIRNIFDLNGISYDAQRIEKWQDCVDMGFHDRNEKELKDIFSVCCSKQTIGILNGKVYPCPFSANADNIRSIPLFEDEILDIKEDTDSALVRENIHNWLHEKSFLKACNYCNGRPDTDKSIPAALQVEKPIKFLKYSR